jgi:hypothetical protein
MVKVYALELDLEKEPKLLPLTEILVRLDGKDPLRVTVYPPAAAPLEGFRLDTEESWAGSPPPPGETEGLTEGVTEGVTDGIGAQTARQEPSTFTQELETIFQSEPTFIYPQVVSVSLDTVRQVPSTLMYVAMV